MVVLDGWGCSREAAGNAIAAAATPTLDELGRVAPSAVLAASGRAVGLPDGIMGNSEVGHLTLGCGCAVPQDLVRIGDAVADGSIGDLPGAQDAFRAVRESGGRLHWFGLCSDAGVHSDLAHLEALVRAAARAGVAQQLIHCFTDGRDTPPDSAAGFVERVEGLCAEVEGAHVATVEGRYWAMDRDQRWDRTEKAWRTLVEGEGERAESALAAVRRSHERGVTDEFIEPTLVHPAGAVRAGDGVVHFNFRADRTRQLTRAFTETGFAEFPVRQPRLACYVTMTRYGAAFDLPVIFAPQPPPDTVGEAFSRAGWPQLRLAETEKYAHVTYFFNGGREEAFEGEERALVPSPRVPTYDATPAMSAPEVTDRAVEWIARPGRRLLVMNYANADMVGHTGCFDPTVAACEAVDEGLGRVVAAVREAGGLLVVTADHGNAECMRDGRGGPHTAHTTAPVPVHLLDARPGEPSRGIILRDGGGLADLAATLLRLTGVRVPEGMSSRGLERR